MTNLFKTGIFLMVFLLAAKLVQARELSLLVPVPPETIKITASSEFRGAEAVFAVNGSGLVHHAHRSDNLGKNMWLSEISDKATRARENTQSGVVWLLAEFDKVRQLNNLKIWNHNQDNHTNRGLQKVYFQYSLDGRSWKTLKNGAADFFIIPKAQGRKLEPANFELPLNGLSFRYFCITADLAEGNYYHDHSQKTLDEAKALNQNINYYGLSEVQFLESKRIDIARLDKITDFTFEAFPAYKKTGNGPSREYKLTFDKPLFAGGKLELSSAGKLVAKEIPVSSEGIYEVSGLFPAGYMEQETSWTVHFSGRQGELSKHVSVAPARKWVLYFLPHSHLDIGYTHNQPEVLNLQIRNLKRAMDLIDKTRLYPDGSGFKWNVEVLWPVTEWMKREQGGEYRERFREYVKSGRIGLNGSLGSILTGICKQEELMHLCDDVKILEKETGTPIQSVMMSDVPGLAWGTVTGLAQNGIKYLSMAPNYVPFLPTGGSRVGYVHREWGDYPFYWESQSGDEKVLYWASGKGYSFFHDWLAGKLSASGLSPVWQYLDELEAKRFPYDISYLRYTVNGDNGPPDEQMSEVIRNWNETYEFPKFKIGTTGEVFSALEGQYGATIPSFKGDFTPYWEDGAASTAAELALNRNNSDRLGQLEIFWSVVHAANFPYARFYEAWRNVVLFSEHTWGASASYSDYKSEHTQRLWNEKKSFALKADSITRLLMPPNSEKKEFIHVFNSCAWARTDVVKITGKEISDSMCLVDEQGETTELQKLPDGQWIFIARDVPALSSKVYRLSKGKILNVRNKTAAAMEANLISNGQVSVEINPKNGAIRRLTLGADTFNYASGAGLNEYIYYGTNLSNLKHIEALDSVQLVSSGPVAAVVRVKSNAPGCNKLSREYTLYRGLDRLDIKNTLDKKEVYAGENVRFCFPFNIPNSETAIDLGFSKARPEREQLAGSNKNFYCMNNGVSVEGQKYAVLLASTDAPIMEIGDPSGEDWMKDRKDYFGWRMAAQSSPILYSWVMNNSWHTNYKATQSGEVSFRYSIVPLKPYSDLAKKIAFESAQPLQAYFSDRAVAEQANFFITGTDRVAVSSLRPVQDGSSLFVRLVNTASKPVRFEIASRTKSALSVTQCDNKENDIRDLGNSPVWIKPYGTINLKLK